MKFRDTLIEYVKRLATSDKLLTMLKQGKVVILSQLLVICAMPLLTRLYSTADFGLLGLFISLTTILAALPALGMSEAVTAAPNHREASQVLRIAGFFILCVGALLTLVSILAIRFDVLGYGALPAWLSILIYPMLVALAVTATLQFWLVRNQDWLGLRRLTMWQAILRVGAQVGLGLLQIGFVGLILGEFIMRLGVAIYAWVRSAKSVLASNVELSASTARTLIFQYKNFPFSRVPSNLLTSVNAMIIVPLVIAFYGISVGGLYTLVESVVGLPIGVATKSVGDVFIGHIVELIQQRKSAVRFMVFTALGLLGIILVPCVILFFFGPDLFALFFGEQWRRSGSLAALLVPVLLLRFTIAPLSGALNVANRPELKLIFDFSVVLIIVGVFSAAYRFGLALEDTITIYAWLMALAYVLLGSLVITAIRNPKRLDETN